jgi:RNA polymerase sigma-70 factor (ECF subfamily)
MLFPIYIASIETPDDRNKAEQLFKKYKDMMFNVANKKLRNNSLAEDAVHNAFVKIIENLSKIGEVSCPQTASYCVIICERVAIDMLRREHRDKFVDVYADNSIDELAAPTNLEDETILKMDKELLVSKIAELPDDYRTIIYLHYSNGLSLKEIAKTLNISLENAKKRLQRARQKLETMLKEGGFDYAC